MKRIDFVDDCKLIQQELLNMGVEASLAECQSFWRWVSKRPGQAGYWRPVRIDLEETICQHLSEYPGYSLDSDY